MYDIISLAVPLLIELVLLVSIFFKNGVLLTIVIVSIFVSLSSELFKKIIGHFFDHDCLLRPNNGMCTYCTLFNGETLSENEIGFPSSHMSTATFISLSLSYFVCMSLEVTITVKILLYSLAVLFIGIVGLSRYKKRCHNIVQILAGFVYGILIMVIFIRKI